jgi:hypothetical protein
MLINNIIEVPFRLWSLRGIQGLSKAEKKIAG